MKGSNIGFYYFNRILVKSESEAKSGDTQIHQMLDLKHDD